MIRFYRGRQNMNHIIEFIDQNVVVVAKNFNVAILNLVWLHKNGIFTEEELQGATCLPVTVEIRSDIFRFSIVPDRLQFSVKPGNISVKDLISSKAGKIISLLPHTPFVAAGLNFIYHVTPGDGDIHSLTRALFCNEKSRLFDGLDSDDVRFGGYFSKNIIDTRMRLDAKPISINKKSEIEEKLQFSFNFNINLNINLGQDNNYQNVIELFSKWDDAEKITKDTINKINRED